MGEFALEVGLHWGAVALYIVAAVLLTHAVLFSHPQRVAWGEWALLGGLVPHSAALILRWIESGHGPYLLKYEILSSNAWIGLVMLALFLRWRRQWTAISLVVLPICILMVGIGLFTNPEMQKLPPTFRSIWLVYHILFNKLAVGAFLLSVGTAVLLLRKLKGASSNLLDRLPSVEVMDAYLVRFVGFGFIFWTTTVAAGAVWADQSWGRYWAWDPIETWSFITWICYGSFLHARLFLRMGPKKTAWFALACFGISLLTVFIMPLLLPSMHSAYFQ